MRIHWGMILMFLVSWYIFIVIIIWLGKQRMLVQVPRKEEYLFPTFQVEMTDGTKVRAVYRKSQIRKEDAPLLLFFRGTRSNLQLYTVELDLLAAESGFDLLTFDYRGSGLSEGKKLKEEHIIQDAEQIYHYAIKTLGYNPKQIVVYGYSMGSVPATWIAAQFPIALCIIHQGFAHFALELEPLVKPWFRKTILSPRKHLSMSKETGHLAPLLVFHGIHDLITPPHQAYSLIEVAHKQNRPHALLWLQSGHLSLFEDPRVIRMLNRISHNPTKIPDL